MSFDISQYLTEESIKAFCQKYLINRLSLFGSAIHGELTPQSDIDILVEFRKEAKPDFFILAQMESELSGVLRRPVDIRTPEDLSPYFRNEVLQEAEVQFEENRRDKGVVS